MKEAKVRIETTRPTHGRLQAAWLMLPIHETKLKELLGIEPESEDYRITEKELPFPDDVSESTTIETLNDLYRMYESLPAGIKEEYPAFLKYYSNLEELYNYRESIIHHAGCHDMADVARHMLAKSPAHGLIAKYFDYEACGQYLADNGRFIETKQGIYEIPL